jgi:RNA polymerase sigma-70 factor (ECF subfamily)
MGPLSTERALWIGRHILPHECALRAQLARWRLPHDLDADDVIQECYAKLAVLESVDDIRNPRNYLYSVARTILLMHVRRARIVSIRAVDDVDAFALPSDDPSPEEQVSDREQLHLLALAISELPDPGRSAFLMRMTDQLSHKEIGARLGMSDNAVQKSIAKTLGYLMARLGRGGNADARASSGHERKDEHDRHG